MESKTVGAVGLRVAVTLTMARLYDSLREPLGFKPNSLNSEIYFFRGLQYEHAKGKMKCGHVKVAARAIGWPEDSFIMADFEHTPYGWDCREGRIIIPVALMPEPPHGLDLEFVFDASQYPGILSWVDNGSAAAQFVRLYLATGSGNPHDRVINPVAAIEAQ